MVTQPCDALPCPASSMDGRLSVCTSAPPATSRSSALATASWPSSPSPANKSLHLFFHDQK